MRFDVPVHEPGRVSLRERRAHVGEDPNDAPRRLRAAVDDELVQRHAVDQLHGVVERPVLGPPEVEDLDRVRVGETARHLHLALEARDGLRSRARAGQELERRRPAQERVPRAIHLAHPPLADLRLERVLPEAPRLLDLLLQHVEALRGEHARDHGDRTPDRGAHRPAEGDLHAGLARVHEVRRHDEGHDRQHAYESGAPSIARDGRRAAEQDVRRQEGEVELAMLGRRAIQQVHVERCAGKDGERDVEHIEGASSKPDALREGAERDEERADGEGPGVGEVGQAQEGCQALATHDGEPQRKGEEDREEPGSPRELGDAMPVEGEGVVRAVRDEAGVGGRAISAAVCRVCGREDLQG